MHCTGITCCARAIATIRPLQDEYEDPREIRSVRVNRGPKAQKAALAALATPDARLNASILGQLFHEIRRWPDSNLRRSYVGRGHGGQRRAFKVYPSLCLVFPTPWPSPAAMACRSSSWEKA